VIQENYGWYLDEIYLLETTYHVTWKESKKLDLLLECILRTKIHFSVILKNLRSRLQNTVIISVWNCILLEVIWKGGKWRRNRISAAGWNRNHCFLANRQLEPIRILREPKKNMNTKIMLNYIKNKNKYNEVCGEEKK
jgi:hypothetical protein